MEKYIAEKMREASEPYIGKHIESEVIAKSNKKVDHTPTFWPGELNMVESKEPIDKSVFTNMSAIEKLVGGENDAEDRAEKNMIQTLTAFCGADFVIVVDGQVNGEIEAIHLDSLDKGREVKIDIAIFSNMHENTLSTLNGSKIYQVFANEYGYALIREFNNVTFVGEVSSISVDDVTPFLRYVYSCESYTNFRVPVDETEVSKIIGTYKEPDPEADKKYVEAEMKKKKEQESWNKFHDKWRNRKNCMFYDGDLGALLRNPIINELLVEGKLSIQNGMLCVSSKWRGPKPVLAIGSELEEKLLEVKPNCYIGKYNNGWVLVEYNHDAIVRECRE